MCWLPVSPGQTFFEVGSGNQTVLPSAGVVTVRPPCGRRDAFIMFPTRPRTIWTPRPARPSPLIRALRTLHPATTGNTARSPRRRSGAYSSAVRGKRYITKTEHPLATSANVIECLARITDTVRREWTIWKEIDNRFITWPGKSSYIYRRTSYNAYPSGISWSYALSHVQVMDYEGGPTVGLGDLGKVQSNSLLQVMRYERYAL